MIIITPNKSFNGTIAGVQFEKGHAETKNLRLIQWAKEKGYGIIDPEEEKKDPAAGTEETTEDNTLEAQPEDAGAPQGEVKEEPDQEHDIPFTEPAEDEIEGQDNLEQLTKAELKMIAESKGIEVPARINKEDLLDTIRGD